MLFIYNKIFNQTALTVNFTFAILVVMFMLYLFLLSCLCRISSCCHVYAISLLVVMIMPYLFLLSCLCRSSSCCRAYAMSPLIVMFISYLFLLCLFHTSSCCHAIHLLVTMFMSYLFLIPRLCGTSFISSFQTQFARQSKIFSLPINQGKSFWRWEQMSDYKEDTVCITRVNCLRRKDPSG